MNARTGYREVNIFFQLICTIVLFLMLFGMNSVASCAPVTTVIAQDSFDYMGNTHLTGQTGGTGWSSDWLSDSVSFTDFYTDPIGLNVPGVVGVGGKIVFKFIGNLLNDAARTLPMQDSGVVFIQFLSQFGTQSGGGTPSVRLVSSGVLTGGVGNNGGCSGSKVYAILDATLSPVAASCSSVLLSALSVVVLRIDYTSNITRMWVLSDLTGFDYLHPPAPSAEYAGLAPAFDRIAIYSRSPASLDELRVFRVVDPAASALPVPAISTWALWGGSALLLLLMAGYYRRLRHPR